MCQISWSILSLVKSLTAAVIALALVGCGFQLRGQDLINSGYSYVVSGEAKDSRLARELSARLFQSGVLAQDAAEITVELIDVRPTGRRSSNRPGYVAGTGRSHRRKVSHR